MKTIVLEGGKGNRKKFNGNKAQVVGRNGDWIDAQLDDALVEQ